MRKQLRPTCPNEGQKRSTNVLARTQQLTREDMRGGKRLHRQRVRVREGTIAAGANHIVRWPEGILNVQRVEPELGCEEG